MVIDGHIDLKRVTERCYMSPSANSIILGEHQLALEARSAYLRFEGVNRNGANIGIFRREKTSWSQHVAVIAGADYCR